MSEKMELYSLTVVETISLFPIDWKMHLSCSRNHLIYLFYWTSTKTNLFYNLQMSETEFKVLLIRTWKKIILSGLKMSRGQLQMNNNISSIID